MPSASRRVRALSHRRQSYGLAAGCVASTRTNPCRAVMPMSSSAVFYFVHIHSCPRVPSPPRLLVRGCLFFAQAPIRNCLRAHILGSVRPFQKAMANNRKVPALANNRKVPASGLAVELHTNTRCTDRLRPPFSSREADSAGEEQEQERHLHVDPGCVGPPERLRRTTLQPSSQRCRPSSAFSFSAGVPQRHEMVWYSVVDMGAASASTAESEFRAEVVRRTSDEASCLRDCLGRPNF